MWASVGAAVCFSSGTEIAYWLFWTKKMTGERKAPAKVIASWGSPSLVPPSPKYTIVTMSLPSFFAPIAKPVACSAWVPIGMASRPNWCSCGSWLESHVPR